MKPLPIVAAVATALFLMGAPLAATAAGAITFSSPASGSSFTNGTSYTVAGTISNPGSGISVFLSVRNPSGVTVDAASVTTDPSTGAFTYPTAAGGTSNWVTGTYTITGTATNGDTGTISFSYTAPTSTSFNQTKALLTIEHQNQEILGNLSSISSAIAALSTSVGALSNSISGISNQLNSITSSLTSITSSLSSVTTAANNAANAANTAATDATNAANAVSNTQTYVLVVAVLAAITVVLELAILVRKLS